MDDMNEKFFTPNIPWQEARILSQVLQLGVGNPFWKNEEHNCIVEWSNIFKESIKFYESLYLTPSNFVEETREAERNIPRINPPE